MTDLAFLTPQADSALLAGNASALPTGGVAPGGGPQGPESAGAFPAMLNDRLKTAIEQTAVAGEGSATQGQGLAAAGNSVTLEGNVLPVPADAAAALETATDSDAAAVLTTVLNAGELPTPLNSMTAGSETLAAQPATDQVEAMLATLAQHPLSAGVPPAAGAAQAAPQGLAQAAWAGRNPMAQAMGTGAAIPLAMQSANPATVPPTGEDEAAAMLAAPIARPVSASAQLALARAGIGLARGMEQVSAADNGLTRDMQTLSGLDRLRLMSGITPAQTTGVSATKFPVEHMLASLQQDTSAIAESGNAALLSGGQRPGNISGATFSPMPTFNVSTSVGQSGWANELGQRVSWMANSELREAQLQLHPRSLGSVEVRIVFGADQSLNVSFSAANAVAREALDASLPRLREMFEQQGLNLNDATVSQESFAEQQRRRQSGPDDPVHLAEHGESEELSANAMADTLHVNVTEGLLNAYA